MDKMEIYTKDTKQTFKLSVCDQDTGIDITEHLLQCFIYSKELVYSETFDNYQTTKKIYNAIESYVDEYIESQELIEQANENYSEELINDLLSSCYENDICDIPNCIINRLN